MDTEVDTKMDNTIVAISAGDSSSSSSNTIKPSSSSSSSKKTNTTDNAKTNALATCPQKYHKTIDYFNESMMRLKELPADQQVMILKGMIIDIFRWVPHHHWSEIQNIIGTCMVFFSHRSTHP